MSSSHRCDSLNQALTIALHQLPTSVDWVATTFPQNHKDKLIDLNLELPYLSHKAVEKRKNEFYAGRWCAAQAIYQKTGTYLTPKTNPDRSPLWPTGIVGSISHSNNKALSIVSFREDYIGLGVDIQDVISDVEQANILSLILNKDEIELTNSLASKRYFDVFFSAKESLYKALYPSCLEIFEHKDVEIMRVDEDQSILEIRLLKDLKMRWFKGQVFTIRYFVAPAYVLTWLCIKA